MKRKHTRTHGTTTAHAIYFGGPSAAGQHFATIADRIAAIRRAEGNRTPQPPTTSTR